MTRSTKTTKSNTNSAAKQTNATLPQLDLLRTLRSPYHIGELYRQLGYPAALKLGTEYAGAIEELNKDTRVHPDEIDLLVGAKDLVLGAWILSEIPAPNFGDSDLQHIHFEVENLYSNTLRRVVTDFMESSAEYLFSFATPRYDRVIFVKPRREGQDIGKGKSLKIGKLGIDPANPTPHDLEVLWEMSAPTSLTPLEAHRKQNEAFSVERVTRQFFSDYRALFLHTRQTILEHNKNIPIGFLARQTTADPTSLHAFTQRLLGRIIFLMFIQKKGWLNDQPHFLRDLFQTTEQNGQNMYTDALEPLFFQTLNTDRPAGNSHFGRIPYLNGSLFEREYPAATQLQLPNSLFDPKTEGSILHVLGRYNFTVAESSSAEQEISLDPEMLGKVFETMMDEDDAAASGTFYTPRSIVQFMAEETLARYLADQSNLPLEHLLPLVTEPTPQPDTTFYPNQIDQLIQALGNVRVLDPAVGTASMLVGFLSAMIRTRRNLAAHAGNPTHDGSPELAQWKREYIQHCLYGVDIKVEAIEIARLRLWLSLVVDARDPEPLPNLDYKLMAGDGLLETVDGEPFLKVESAMLGTAAQVEQKARAIEAKHAEFFGEQNPEKRKELRQEIANLERELFKLDIDGRIQNLDYQIEELRKRHNDPRRSQTDRNKTKKKLDAYTENREKLIVQRTKVWDEKEPLPFFLHNVHFAEVMKDENREDNGGFDIVIGNPPYVSIGNMPPAYKASLIKAFPDVENGRTDLYIYFYQKGMHLLRRGGRLAYITPNKFMQTGYGSKLRELLSSRHQVETLIDFGGLKVFSAMVDVAIVMIKNEAPSNHKLSILPYHTLKEYIDWLVNEGNTNVREQLTLFHTYARGLFFDMDANDLTGNEWAIGENRMGDLMKKITERGTPLSELVEGKIYYGIKTGFNDAFVINEAKRKELIAADPKSEEIIKPFLRGRDIKRWQAEWAGEYLIVANHGCNISKYPAILKHLEQYREELSKRATIDKHEWYELQQPQARYQLEFSKPKIMYPDMADELRFTWDETGAFMVNTVYAFSAEKWLLALLNSRATLFTINQMASSLGSGSRRLFTQFMKRLPIANPTPEQQAALETFTDDTRLSELNELVYDIYDLSPDERALIEELTAGAYGE